jgi:UDP-N-acetylmuramyl pentapeptide phosphotransferase/UDP-N-acetylglucosamine-1-phosphate transferase
MDDLTSLAWNLALLTPTAVLAALACGGLIVVLAPLLRAYALARPNARSSHREPTPQGGGAAVIMATFAAAWSGAVMSQAFGPGEVPEFLALTGAAVLLAITGAVDDIRGLGPLVRLVVQCATVAVVLAMLPSDLRIIPMLPWLLERALLLIGCVWMINLTNFMDGIDWMTVAEFVPITAAVIICGLLGAISALPMLVALALLGAMLGFAPFNRPIAKLFLGDVGSLPLGLLLAWLLVHVAGRGYLVAAILLPLYYLADATLTLLRRLHGAEQVWQAHRSHFYQRATDRGLSVSDIVTRVFLVNLALAALALATIISPSAIVDVLALAAGVALVGWLLWQFERGKAA